MRKIAMMILAGAVMPALSAAARTAPDGCPPEVRRELAKLEAEHAGKLDKLEDALGNTLEQANAEYGRETARAEGPGKAWEQRGLYHEKVTEARGKFEKKVSDEELRFNEKRFEILKKGDCY